SSGTFTVKGGHAYKEEGSYTLHITLQHTGAPNTVVTSTATVSDPAVIVTGSTFNAVEGAQSASQAVATFTDPGGAEALADYSAPIDWSDGSTSAGTINFGGALGSTTDKFTVSGSHTYKEESAADHPGSTPYTIRVTVHHDPAPDAGATTTAVVA